MGEGDCSTEDLVTGGRGVIGLPRYHHRRLLMMLRRSPCTTLRPLLLLGVVARSHPLTR